MNPRNKREILSEILGEHGYPHWVVIGPNQPNADAPYILCNFIERRQAEVAIPDPWFDDPRRYNTIGELIALAIDNSPAVSQLVTEKLLDLVPDPNSVFRR